MNKWGDYSETFDYLETCPGEDQVLDIKVSYRLRNADTSEYPDVTNVLITHAGDGKSYPRNTTKALCDWNDGGADNDNDPNLPGSGDHFVASLYSTWFNIRNMFQTPPTPTA